MRKAFIIGISILYLPMLLIGQKVPGEFEHIDYLVTFGKSSNTSWGDDDFTQVFFFVIPPEFSHPVFLRVYDPDTGGALDQQNDMYDTYVRFSIHGGKGAYTDPDAKKIDPTGNYKSGTLIMSKVFGHDPKYDNEWYTFGPINPLEGEYIAELGGNVIKVIAEGVKGNDGNLYKYFLSTQYGTNSEVEGANAFTFEYSFRLPEKTNDIVHLYPFIDRSVVSIKQHNFDMDGEGKVMLYSITKNRHPGKNSGNDDWSISQHPIDEEEKNTSIDIQIIKTTNSKNDVVAYITNQYDQPVPFFSNPIGGPPKYKYKVNMIKGQKND